MDCFAQVVLEKQNNQTVASYTYGDDLLSQTISTGTNFYGYDGLGSTKFLTDTAGNITDTYQYDAYGEITSKTGTTDNNYLYTGEQFDRSLNQYYLRARYYNQGVGRFTQMDTHNGFMRKPTSLNKYLYANAAPTFYVDPSGKFGIGGLMSGLNGMTSLMTSAARYGAVAVNAYDKVDNMVTLVQMTRGTMSALHQFSNQMRMPDAHQDEEFLNALNNIDEAAMVLASNFAWLAAESKKPKIEDKIEQFLKNRKNKFLIYAPTPYSRSSVWFGPGTRIPVGHLKLGRGGTRDIEIELGRASGQGGRMVGVGHSHGTRRTQGSQWWRMDWHERHHQESYDKPAGSYHFHTETVR